MPSSPRSSKPAAPSRARSAASASIRISRSGSTTISPRPRRSPLSRPHSARSRSLVAVGAFADTVFVAPLVTAALLDLYAAYHRVVKQPGCRAHYRTGRWVPHVTLATELAPDPLACAVASAARVWKPCTAQLTALRLVEFHPVATRGLWTLGNG